MQENFETRIMEIAKLKKGWNFGKGEPFDEKHVAIAAQLAMRYYKKYSITVSGTPNEDGSIDLMFNIHDTFLDVKVLPSISEVNIKYSRGIGKDRTEEMWGIMNISKMDTIMDKFVNL